MTIHTFVLLGAVMLAGCISKPPHVDPPDSKEEACSLAITAKNENAVPTSIQVTFRNITNAKINVALPGPLCGESEDAPPYPIIGILLKDPSGRKEDFAFVHPNAANPPKPKFATLKPGESAVVSYDLKEFYRWGSCGPDRWGHFVKYFQKGSAQITMQAIWMPDVKSESANIIKSNIQSFNASNPAWLFKN